MLSHECPRRGGGTGQKGPQPTPRRQAATTQVAQRRQGKGRTGEQMSDFMGTHRNRLDRKGRVSVPAQFRASLARLGSPELVLRPSHKAACIDVWTRAQLDAAAPQVNRLALFSDDADVASAVLYADAWPTTPDAEGRIVLPEDLIAHAGLEKESEIAFLGLGPTFAVWRVADGLAWLADVRARARSQNLTVPRQ
jgi:MraZ protein